jgi:glycosyltransferase involved in cell wall biosynthesis
MVKRICVVGSSKRFMSGISYYTICLSNTLQENKKVSVICFRQLLPTFIFPGHSHVGGNISNLTYNPKIPVFDKMDYNNPITWYKAYKFIKEQEPDVIILQWWSATVAHMQLLIKMFAKLTNKPQIIIEFHEVIDPFEDSILPIKIYSKISGNLLRSNVSACVTHSKADKQLVCERYNILPEKVHVISHGLYDQYGDPIDNKSAKSNLGITEEYVILSFGLIRSYKGIPNLIKAFNDLPPRIISQARLLIVGEIWEDKSVILTQIECSPFRDKITLVNEYVPDDMVRYYFSAANVVVLPYLRASQSGVAHIGMAFGKPIIVTKVGGLKESMADYQGTYFIKPNDIPELRHALINKCNDKTIYPTPPQTWKKVADDYNKLLDSL